MFAAFARSRRLFTSIAVFLLFVFFSQAAIAQLPTIRLNAVFPPSGQQGTEVDFTITAGADLEGCHALHFSHRGITAVQKTQTVEGKDEPEPVANQFTVTIAEDVPPGLYDVRAIGDYGISNPRMFVVSDRAELVETESNNTADTAIEVPLESVISGRAEPAADIDYYRFTAKAGQRVLVRCQAAEIDSRMDPVLELYDASGALLEMCRGRHGPDSLLDFQVSADGDYFVKVYDFVYGGSAEHFYRLSIGTAPHIDFVMPPAALPGTQGQFVIYGRNLPSGSPTEWTTRDGKPLEQMTVDIAVPEEPDAAARLDWQASVDARSALLDGFAYRLESPQGVSNPVLIGIATAPVVQETEPNDSPAEAQQVELPCEFVGRFQSPGDEDWLTFTASKGQVFWIEVFSERLGLPTDPYLLLQRVTQNDQGAEQIVDIQELHEARESIAGNRFFTGSDDPRYRFSVPDDGTYRILIRDLYHDVLGDPSHVYRLSIREETPDFRLVARAEFPRAAGADPNDEDPWTTLVRKGGTDKIQVLAFRRDGFNAPIDVTVEGLPEGVACPGATIGPDQSFTWLIVSAAETAEDWAGTIRIIGQARLGDEELVREARPAATIWPIRATPGRSRLTREYALAVRETAPYGVAAGIEGATLWQNQRLDVPLTVTRRGDFQGQVALTAAHLPAKVQNETVNVAAEQSESVVHLFAEQDAPPGRYTFIIQATTQVAVQKPGAEKPENRNVVDASTPITVTIKPGPLTLAPKVPGDGVIKQGGKIDIPVDVARRNEFAGPVTLDLLLPPGISGITVAAVEVAPDAAQGTLVVEAAADATEGNHAHVAVRATIEIDGEKVELHQPISLNVQK